MAPQWKLYPARNGKWTTIPNKIKHRNSRHFPSKTIFCRCSSILQRLTVTRVIDQFGRKRCKRKHKDLSYQHLWVSSKILCCTRAVDWQSFIGLNRKFCKCFLFWYEVKKVWHVAPLISDKNVWSTTKQLNEA